MSNNNDDVGSTLIPKDNDEQWRKTLHGEIESISDENLDAKAIRQYLLVRDEALAVNSTDDSKDLARISESEARVIYHRVTDEIRRRTKKTWLDHLKNYSVAIVIGVLSATVAFLLLTRNNGLPSTSVVDGQQLNYNDYKILTLKDEPPLLPNMILIPGGITSIGCAKGWDDTSGGCRSTEFPSHTVMINTFEISQHEVTVGQFQKFIDSTGYVTAAEKQNRGCVHQDKSITSHPFVMNKAYTWKNPGYEQNHAFPVTCISWDDAQHYIQWLSEETKTSFRLPTEAEWEHAARGAQSTAYFWGSIASHDQANYAGTGGKDKWPNAAPVGQFPANKYSVQDMSGNLWEWVQDCWHDNFYGAPTDGSAWEHDCKGSGFKVRRGGAWDATAAGVRSAIRSSGYLHDRSNLYGFRVAREWQKAKVVSQ